MGMIRAHKNCPYGHTEVIKVSEPSEEFPDVWQFQCPRCDPNRKHMFNKGETELVPFTGATYNERAEMMRKEKEGEEETTFITREKPKIRGEII